MLPDNIDDLFRQKLDGHATPPAPDLWARLSLPAAEADPVDATFQDGLRAHATPPRRELWERLEDEHLRPQQRRRRVVAWWQLSAAAVLLLMLVGGALWSGSWRQATTGGAVASHPEPTAPTGRQPALKPAISGAADAARQPQIPVAAPALDLATSTAPAAPKKNQEIFSPQATATPASTSSTPIASTTRPRRPATAPQASTSHQPQRSQPDAAMSTLAKLGGRKTPSGQSLAPSSQPTTPAVTPPTHTNDAPILALAPAAPAATPEIIEVEVRRGAARPEAAPVAVVAVADAAPAPARRRGLRLGGLLRQADHLVHGELAEATGLPETVTLQARLGGRLVSKTIQL
jgi:hypothetical protein